MCMYMYTCIYIVYLHVYINWVIGCESVFVFATRWVLVNWAPRMVVPLRMGTQARLIWQWTRPRKQPMMR